MAWSCPGSSVRPSQSLPVTSRTGLSKEDGGDPRHPPARPRTERREKPADWSPPGPTLPCSVREQEKSSTTPHPHFASRYRYWTPPKRATKRETRAGATDSTPTRLPTDEKT